MSNKKFKKLRKIVAQARKDHPDRNLVRLKGMTHTNVNHPETQRGAYRWLKKKIKEGKFL